MRASSGFTLIEVMIAVFVLGIGLLGVAGLQSVSASLNQQSYMRSQATLLAGDIADRMRANRSGVEDDDYDMGGGASAVPNEDCESTTGCSPAEMAGHDLTQWTQSVADALPQPPGAGAPADRAVVCIDDTPKDGSVGSPACDGAGSTYAIKLWWYDKENADGGGGTRGDTERFVTEFRP